MNPFRKVFNKFLNFVAPKTKHEVVVPDQKYTIAAPKPGEVRKHPLHSSWFGTFSPIKDIGGHPVRGVCSTRAFKEAFEKDYGVKLR
jgi:hypothetical protein